MTSVFPVSPTVIELGLDNPSSTTTTTTTTTTAPSANHGGDSSSASQNQSQDALNMAAAAAVAAAATTGLVEGGVEVDASCVTAPATDPNSATTIGLHVPPPPSDSTAATAVSLSSTGSPTNEASNPPIQAPAATTATTATPSSGTATSTATATGALSTGGDYTSSGALDALAALASATSQVINADPHEHNESEGERKGERDIGRDLCSRSPSPEQLNRTASMVFSAGHDTTFGRPKRMGRLRSVSNPEGMEKWDSMGSRTTDRRHFVLPSSILEEELADAQLACDRGYGRRGHPPQTHHHQQQPQPNGYDYRHQYHRGYIEEEPMELDHDNFSSSAQVTADSTFSEEESRGLGTAVSPSEGAEELYSGEDEEEMEEEEEEDVSKDEEEEDLSNLPPEELLRRARARLLEEMSTEHGAAAASGGGGAASNKGVLPLPHSLGKYKEVYNKNGRIGIYTPAERAAIIARFQSKRSRRVWKKKIRYNCRKSLADRRVRVKGRFVKRDYVEKPAEQAAAAAAADESQSGKDSGNTDAGAGADGPSSVVTGANANANANGQTSLSGDQQTATENDADMPDVNDKDAGFDKPSAKQPYRRTRRHTFA